MEWFALNRGETAGEGDCRDTKFNDIFSGEFMKKNTKLFLSYVLPSMIGMLIVGSYSIVDTIFIGWSAGELGLASVAVTWPLVMLFGAVGDMLGTGAAIIISQSRGNGDLRRARRSFANMLVWQVVFSAAMTVSVYMWLVDILRLFGASDELIPGAVRYARILIVGNLAYMLVTAMLSVIRNDGRPVLSMWLMIGGLLLNVALDYLFIFPLGGGIAGAAYATVVSQVVIAVAGLTYFTTGYTELRFDWAMFKLKFKYLKDILVNGFPSLGNQLSIIAMLFFHNYQALKYGQVNGLAAYTFVGAVESLGSLLMTGLSLGVQPLVAYLSGGRRYRRQNVIGNMGYYTAFGLGIVMTGVSVAGHNVFPGWFNLHGEAAALAAHGLIISSTAFVLLGVVRVAGYYYQATGKIIDSSLLIYGDAFVALPLCLFTLPLWFGMDGVWLAMPVSRVLLFLFVCYLWFGKKAKPQPRRHFSGKGF